MSKRKECILLLLWASVLCCYRGADFNWNVKVFSDTLTYSRIEKVIWGNAEFVAIVGGVVYKSTDGANWVVQNSNEYVSGLTWGNGQYVGFTGAGGKTNSGQISTSPDAVTWTNVSLSPSTELHDLIWANSKYVAVGAKGVLFTSPDAVTWISVATGIKEDLYKILWSNNRFFAVGDQTFSDNHVYTSVDNIVWSVVGFPKNNRIEKPFYTDVAWGKSGFIVAGFPSSYYSADGVKWSIIEPSFSIENVAWCDGKYQYVGVKLGGGWFDAPRIYSSNDGKTWYEHIDSKYGGDMFFKMYFSSIACHGDIYVAGGSCGAHERVSCIMHSP